MYYAIGVSAPSLHRVYRLSNMIYKHIFVPIGTLQFLTLEAGFVTVIPSGDNDYGIYNLIFPLQFGQNAINSIYVS